jgi:hypothetical protein
MPMKRRERPRISTNMTMRAVAVCSLVAMMLVLAAGAHERLAGQVRAQQPVPVVVELFTSEGCSSCPPADALLTKLVSNTPVPGTQVITLSEHVDYWDQQGWRDPFSNASFTARQRAYVDHGVGDDAYTPQMIVDGETAFIGSDTGALIAALTRAVAKPKAPIAITWTAGTTPTAVIALAANPLTTHASVVVAVTEDGLVSAVRRGENAGRTLSHSSVTRRLSVVGQTSADGSFKLELPIKIDGAWSRKALRLVVFAQTSKRAITAATASPVPF